MDRPIETLKNLGPRSAAWLAEAGIRTRADLAAVGPVEAFRRVEDLGHGPSLNLLYAMAAALEDVHWAELSEREKESLRNQVSTNE